MPLTPNGEVRPQSVASAGQPAICKQELRARPQSDTEHDRRRDLGEAVLQLDESGAAITSSNWVATRCWRSSVVSRVRQAN